MLEDNLSRKFGADPILPRERKAGDAFQNRALASGLVAAHDQLGKIDVVSDATGSKSGNLFQATTRFCRMEL